MTSRQQESPSMQMIVPAELTTFQSLVLIETSTNEEYIRPKNFEKHMTNRTTARVDHKST